MKVSSNAHLRRTLLCALFAGSIAAPFAAQTAYALPIEGANAATNKTEADISTSGTVMDITGKTDHNILKWEDFSIDSGEKVRFDRGNQTRDYLNLVTGEGASNIYGTIEGGRNVYLVNPHGILFAKDSQVNTGALYLSTANPADIAAATNTFKTNGTSPLSASAQMGDVLNLGTVKASKLYIEGKNVKVLNTDAVTDANGTALTGASVIIRSEEKPHIGYDVGNKTAPSNTPSDYGNPNTAKSATGRSWDVKKLDGTAYTKSYDYMRVYDIHDLQNIENNKRGRYMLARDIDASETATWNSGEGFKPIGMEGENFTGQFDGVRHTIRGLHINRPYETKVGLFGETAFDADNFYTAESVRIENFSLVNSSVKGSHQVGGVVGLAQSTIIQNVSFSGTVEGADTVGGIVGCTANTTVQNVCNAGTVKGGDKVGGIVGELEGRTVQNVWSTAQVEGTNIGGIVGRAVGGSILHAVWKTGSAGQAFGTFTIAPGVQDAQAHTEAEMKQAATYAGWKDEHGKALVATEGGVGTPWRIYEGKTMPLLTALMKGTKRLANREQVYDGTAPTIAGGDHISLDAEKNVGTYHAYSEQYDIIGGAYTVKPKELTLDFTGGARFDKTYDGNANVTQSLTKGTNYSLTGFVGSEGTGIALASSTGTYSDKNAAADKTVTFDGLTLTGAGAGNYTLDKTSLTGIGTILRRALTLGAVGAQTKTYDGTTDADTSKFGAVLNNAIAGDKVTATATGAAYNDKNVAGASRIDYTGVALAGSDAGNYTLAATTAQGAGTIAKRALTLDVAAQSKTYDGTTAADTSKFRATLGNLVAGEENSVTATASGATYNDKNVAAASKVSYTGLALTGTGAGNYTLAATTAQGAGSITKRALTVGAVAAQTKIYDGTTSADAAQFQATLGNFVAGEEGSATVTAIRAAYNDKNVAGANTVNYTGVALKGTGAGNYSIASTAQGAGTITRRALTLGAVESQSKTYDGTTAADTSKFRAALVNTVEGDNVTAAATTATFNDKNVAAANRIDYTGVALRGADAGNYTLAATTAQGAGAITKRTLTASAVGAQTKTYDGTTAADASQFHATLNNVVTGEENSVTATAAGAAYNDKNVAGANAVGYTGVALRGTGAGNYTIADTAQGTGTITQRALTLGAVTSEQTKTYDGTTAADASQFSAALTNAIAGDSVTATATGAAYNDKNVAAANHVDYTGVALTGADAGNYSLAATTAQGAGTITHRELTLTADDKTATQGEPLSSFTGKAQGFAAGEDERVFGAGGLTFTTTASDTNTLGSYAVVGKAGGIHDGVVGNYRIRQAAGNATAFTVNAAPLVGGILTALVQDATPRFDFGFDNTVYLYGTPRLIRALTLGFYRFDAERDLEIQGLHL